MITAIKVILGLLFEVIEWLFGIIFFWRKDQCLYLYRYEVGPNDLFPSRFTREEAKKRQIKNRQARNSRRILRKNRKKR